MSEPIVTGSMPFLEHLGELRSRIFKASIAIFIGFFVAWSFHVELYAFLSGPVREALANNNQFTIKALSITESIEVYMRLAMFGAVVLASPFVFYQMWAFIAPGLLSNEKRMIGPVIAGSVSCFLIGTVFCYLVVLPFMTDFLIKMTTEAPDVALEPTLATTMSFSITMLLAFGAVFELPLFMYVLASMGIVTAKGFLGFYRYWAVIAFIIGAVLTPTPDPINQSLMAAPLVLLYGVGVLIAWLVQRDSTAKLPRKTVVMVTVVLALLAFGGVKLALHQTERSALDLLPADVQQVIGIHVKNLERMQQTAERSPKAARALGPFALLQPLNLLDKLTDPVPVLARLESGAVLLLEVADAPAQVQRLAKERQVTLTGNNKLSTVTFRLGGEGQTWQLTSSGKHHLWLGQQGAVVRILAVQSGQKAALSADPLMAERLATLRLSGPLWSLTPDNKALAQWTPGGALAQTIKAASAVLTRDKGELTLRFDCKGPDAAVALRDRIDAWVADKRRDGGGLGLDGEIDKIAGRLRELALLQARATEASARMLPAGSADYQALVSNAAESLKLARELAAYKAVPTATVKPIGPLEQMVQPPATSNAESANTLTTWKIQGDLAQFLLVIAEPSAVGIAVDAAVALPVLVTPTEPLR